jgi:galactonate dehydratase
MAKNLAEHFILGADPMHIEKSWEKMFRSSFWALGGGPVVYGGMSAFDIAFWDIKGKALQLPVYQLLGEKTNDRLRAYASQMQFGWGKTKPRLAAVTPEEYAQETQLAMADGYDAIKVNPLAIDEQGTRNWDNLKILSKERMKLIYDRMKAIRDTAGPHVDIILETHSLLSGTTAIQVGRALYDLDIMYHEETNAPLNPAIMKKVAETSQIPIASGERIYTALHLETVIPNFIIHEHNWQAVKDYNTRLCLQDYQPVHGYYAVPELPGLGLDLNEEVIKDFPTVVVK